MRGLFAITLAVGFVSAANGAISLYQGGVPLGTDLAVMFHDTVTLQVHSDSTLPWEGCLIVEEWGWGTLGSLSNPATYPTAGSLGSNAPYSEPGWGSGYYMLTTGSGIQTGIQHAADFITHDVGMSWVSLWDPAYSSDIPIDYVRVYCGADPGDPYAHAEADGPYEIDIGETITLSGYHSYGHPHWELQWSIAGNYVGGSEMQPISYSRLVDEFGLSPGTYQVELMATAETYVDYDYTTIRIIPEPASCLLFSLGAVLLLVKRGHRIRSARR